MVNFDKYHPPLNMISAKVRGGPLQWFRCEYDWWNDKDIIALPWEERGIWPMLLGLAAHAKPVGSFTVASESDLAAQLRVPVASLSHALTLLRHRTRIKVVRVPDKARAPKRPSSRTKAAGISHAPVTALPPTGHQNSDYVPTYVQTDVRTRDAARKSSQVRGGMRPIGTTAERLERDLQGRTEEAS